MIIGYKKRLYAIFLAGVVLAFGFFSLSAEASEFTDNEKSDVNDRISWTHDYNYDHDHAVSLFSENSTVFNEIRNWVLSDEINQYVTQVNAVDTRWSATSVDKYDGSEIFNAFDTAFSTIGIQEIQALNEDFHFNIYNKPQSVVVFTLQFGVAVSPENSESGAFLQENMKTIEWVYNGSDEYGDHRYIDDYVEYLGDGWHLTMCGYDESNFAEPITTTTSTTTTQPTTTSTTTTDSCTDTTTSTTTIATDDSGSETTTFTTATVTDDGGSETTTSSTSTETITSSTTTSTKTIISDTTTSSETTTISTNTATSTETTAIHIASDEELCDWAVKDYEKKTGVTPENAEIEYAADGNAVITLTNAEGNVLDVYTIDPVIGTGTESNGGEVNLPQTGYSVVYNYIMLAAAAMVFFGIYAMAKSRKKDEE